MDMITKIFFAFALIALAGCAAQTSQEQIPPSGEAYFSDREMQTEPETVAETDIRVHNTLDSCYTIIDGLVYDITDYIEFSPSFKDTGMTHDEFRARLADSCGADGTILFKELFGDNHYRLDSYLIGEAA